MDVQKLGLFSSFVLVVAILRRRVREKKEEESTDFGCERFFKKRRS